MHRDIDGHETHTDEPRAERHPTSVVVLILQKKWCCRRSQSNGRANHPHRNIDQEPSSGAKIAPPEFLPKPSGSCELWTWRACIDGQITEGDERVECQRLEINAVPADGSDEHGSGEAPPCSEVAPCRGFSHLRCS